MDWFWVTIFGGPGAWLYEFERCVESAKSAKNGENLKSLPNRYI
uniref:Uncharacterized protein n=1 Tax=Gordonia phage Petito TaxID=3158876 RepID=A0AAU8GPR3_9CAUD